MITINALRHAVAGAAFLAAAACVAQSPPASPQTLPASPQSLPASPPAQPAPTVEAKPSEDASKDPLAQFAWLEGCWRGEANRRQFREHWLPLRGGLLVGASHTVVGGKTDSYEYLRIENRPDGVYYVATPGGASESAFKFDKATADGGITTYTFVNPAVEFPRQLAYRHESNGWLYATITGKVKGVDRDIIYPMRRIGCESGEFIAK